MLFQINEKYLFCITKCTIVVLNLLSPVVVVLSTRYLCCRCLRGLKKIFVFSFLILFLYFKGYINFFQLTYLFSLLKFILIIQMKKICFIKKVKHLFEYFLSLCDVGEYLAARCFLSGSIKLCLFNYHINICFQMLKINSLSWK